MSDYKGHAKECINPGRDDYWTCPSCYADFGNVGTGEHVCDTCKCIVNCTVEQQPVAHSEVVSWPAEESQS